MFVNFQLLKSKPHGYRGKISECNKNHPKTTWKLINTLTGRSNILKRNSEVKSESETFHHDENISEAIDKFFINISLKKASQVTDPSIRYSESFLQDQAVTIPTFHFIFFPEENVLKTFRHLFVSKGSGLDKISATILRLKL